jgi:hypothetical protein
MALIHGRLTVCKLNSKDLTAYTNSSTVEISADAHDVTTYGATAHTFAGGLKNGTSTLSGFYDSTAVTGPRAAILPIVGTVVPFIHQAEGTGSGKPQDSVDVLVTKYSQTHPVADMVTWSVELQYSGADTTTAQT